VKKNLLVAIAYDVGLFLGLILWFYLDFTRRLGSFGILLPLGFVWLAVFGNKAITKYVADLNPKQKKTRFAFTTAGFVLVIGLVVRWAIHRNNAAAWSFASLGIMIWAALFYAEWDRLNDDLKKAPQATQRAGNEANQSPQPTRPTGR
jgi:dipeptide/tripeptide permease